MDSALPTAYALRGKKEGKKRKRQRKLNIQVIQKGQKFQLMTGVNNESVYNSISKE